MSTLTKETIMSNNAEKKTVVKIDDQKEIFCYNEIEEGSSFLITDIDGDEDYVEIPENLENSRTWNRVAKWINKNHENVEQIIAC
jgi:hypothetical protein